MEYFFDSYISSLVVNFPFWSLLIVVIFGFFALMQSAEWLVNKTVALSLSWKVPRFLISSTIVSLVSTTPELSVSIISALGNRSTIVLGNAIGSVITDSTLILGISLLIKPIVMKHKVLKTQSYIQLIALSLLIGFSLIFSKSQNILALGGFLPKFVGFIFLGLLIVNFIYLIGNSKDTNYFLNNPVLSKPVPKNSLILLLSLIFCVVCMLVISCILVPTLIEIARRLNISESIIGATLVAFGTSVPELITAITSCRRGFSDIAVGNIIGADILNILSVIGFSLIASPKGLAVPPIFYKLYFPAACLSLIIFQFNAQCRKNFTVGPKVGIILICLYVFTTLIGYAL